MSVLPRRLRTAISRRWNFRLKDWENGLVRVEGVDVKEVSALLDTIMKFKGRRFALNAVSERRHGRYRVLAWVRKDDLVAWCEANL